MIKIQNSERLSSDWQIHALFRGSHHSLCDNSAQSDLQYMDIFSVLMIVLLKILNI